MFITLINHLNQMHENASASINNYIKYKAILVADVAAATTILMFKIHVNFTGRTALLGKVHYRYCN